MKPNNFKIVTFLAILTLSMPSKAAEDTQLLMYASKLNTGHRIANECTEFDPRFLVSYEADFQTIVRTLKSRGLTEDAYKNIESTPELASNQYLKKFKSSPIEKQLKWCINILIDIRNDASNAKYIEQQ